MPWSCVQAVSAAAAMVEGSLEDNLSKFLKKNIVKKELTDDVRAACAVLSICFLCVHAIRDCAVLQLGVLDSKLGGLIKESLGIPCVHSQSVLNLVRGIRSQV